ncbi:MAG: 3-ketoacyl-ACP reductase [Firmicutes bacterium]|jgi:3-oxoacyl-[acyl-carrier protein] reductase|nr:3-ketoacyl-ACP reductase [Bacillota bacterium]
MKVAAVTGGSRGIGYAIASALAEEGYSLAILGRSDHSQVKDKIEQLPVMSKPHLYFQGDLGDRASRSGFCQKLVDTFGHIDILVNNAGVAPKVRMDLLETSEESFDYVMDINLKGTFFLTQQIAKLMIQQNRRGKIINISSLSAYTVSINRGEYCLSKAGVGMLTKLFAVRLANHGINVYEIRPGIIDTDMTTPAKAKYDELIAQGLTPIRRWGTPEDVARAVVALSTGQFDFSTGEILNVDGGFHLHTL